MQPTLAKYSSSNSETIGNVSILHHFWANFQVLVGRVKVAGAAGDLSRDFEVTGEGQAAQLVCWGFTSAAID